MTTSITIWAARNKNLARILMVFLHVLLIVLGGFTGKLLTESHIVLPEIFLVLLVAGFIILILIYPFKFNIGKFPVFKGLIGFSAKKRILINSMIASASFLLIVYSTNQITQEKDYKFQFPLIQNVSAEVMPSTNTSFFNDNSVDQKNQLESKIQKHSKHFRFITKDANQTNTPILTGKIFFLFTLITIISLLLIGGLGALACSLACNGYEFFAGILFLGGLFGISLGSALIIRGIVRKRLKEIFFPES